VFLIPDTLGYVAAADLSFVNAHQGWLLLGGAPATSQEPWVLLRTSDGGATWSVVARSGDPTVGAFPRQADSVSMKFITAQDGWIMEFDQWDKVGVNVYRSRDGGHTWNVSFVRLPPTLPDLGEGSVDPPVFTTAEAGTFLVHLNGAHQVLEYHTTDGGKTWDPAQ
jgi:photosystem II stability/assembly factor-like uncharacterized protein